MEKINHEQARLSGLMGDAEVPPDVERETKMVDWAEIFYLNSMRIAAASVLETAGSLDKAASVLWWAGFAVPHGYFPEGHEDEYLDSRDEEALRLWVEAEAERIKKVTGTVGFYVAASGKLFNPLNEHIQQRPGPDS